MFSGTRFGVLAIAMAIAASLWSSGPAVSGESRLQKEGDACYRPIQSMPALGAGLVAATAGTSAVLPRSGATSYVAEVVGRVIDVAELGRGETETLVEVTGVTRNTLGQSAFDQMRAYCLISFTAGGGRPSAVGACREIDGDGDILFTSFDGEGGKLLGGTGKYAGMTGSAVFSVKPEPSSGTGKLAYSVNHDVTWAQK